MTLFATRDANNGTIDVHVTYGPITIKVNEHPDSVRAFWGSLGRLLDQAESDQ